MSVDRHQCVTTTWVTHGGHFARECSTTHQQRGGRTSFSLISWGMIRWQTEPESNQDIHSCHRIPAFSTLSHQARHRSSWSAKIRGLSALQNSPN
uniref:Uncharacterized protein n=1 Tax=Anguilla anguilla TaxID=7936 RepID=A0A0E9WI00_ANGAN